jgi:NAD(P)-dependent dehydrogenase (short-subunit alcohol dehydrogenase family)
LTNWYANELARRLKPFGITSNALHPGLVATGFGSEASGFAKIMLWLARPFSKTPVEGAQTSIYLATSMEVYNVTGKYFKNSRPVTPSKNAQSDLLAAQLWELSERVIKDHTKARA